MGESPEATQQLVCLLRSKGHQSIAEALLADDVDSLNLTEKKILLTLSARTQGVERVTPHKVGLGIAGGSPASGSPGWIAGGRD